jgi:6-phosphofructokinase 1
VKSEESPTACIGVLTSGGDAPGMNAAVRAVVRTALHLGADVFAVRDGYQGLVSGGERIVQMNRKSVTGIIQDGGTILGSARCQEFMSRPGRLRAAHHLLERGIDQLVVIGGDGSLSGAEILVREWPGLVEELADGGYIDRERTARHPELHIAGLVGSIDNDMHGTDLTIGADTALHRIIEAVDAIYDTAVAHQRTFVVKVMGRRCGYLALMSALATGADWKLIPENRHPAGKWKQEMCSALRAGIEAGRRASIVILSEGVTDSRGNPIDVDDVREALEQGLGLEVRVTVLGHVQRGGNASAFDRIQSSLLGYAAARRMIAGNLPHNPCLIGMKGGKIVYSELEAELQKTRAVADAIKAGHHGRARRLRGPFFQGAFRAITILKSPRPLKPQSRGGSRRLAVIHSGAPAPGMNTAVRAVVRFGIARGHIMMAVQGGFDGLIQGHIRQIDWMGVNGWAVMGGANLGTSRTVPRKEEDFAAIQQNLSASGIDGLIVIGGLSGYRGALNIWQACRKPDGGKLAVVCLPATVSNNLPGTEVSVGSDTALNNIVEAVDKIKQSAVALRRCFLVEVAGRYCGYLALMSGLATGAERVYLHEEGFTLLDLYCDLEVLKGSFRQDRQLALLIRSEQAHQAYDTAFMKTLFEAESEGIFSLRQSLLGHLQLGGSPSPFDRILATRLADECIKFMDRQTGQDGQAGFLGLKNGRVRVCDLGDLDALVDEQYQRPRRQWWLKYRRLTRILL